MTKNRNALKCSNFDVLLFLARNKMFQDRVFSCDYFGG